MQGNDYLDTRQERRAAGNRPFSRSVRTVRRSLIVPLTLAPALGLIALLFGTSVVYGIAQSLSYLPFLG
ncbi:MAG: hypothetical protein CYG59_09770, partial [Chloroflexi bacterium]